MQNGKQAKNQQKLLEKIGTTRKARIRAEVRLYRYRFWANSTLIAYALASVILALISAQGIPSNEDFVAVKWASVSIAVVLLPVSAVISTQRFGERAVLMRVCYTQLDSLRQKIEEEDPKLDAHASYQSILALTENHAEIDYLAGNWQEEMKQKSKAKTEQESEDVRITCWEKCRVLWHNYVVPSALVYCWRCGSGSDCGLFRVEYLDVTVLQKFQGICASVKEMMRIAKKITQRMIAGVDGMKGSHYFDAASLERWPSARACGCYVI